jgi:hypothetical protein
MVPIISNSHEKLIGKRHKKPPEIRYFLLPNPLKTSTKDPISLEIISKTLAS